MSGRASEEADRAHSLYSSGEYAPVVSALHRLREAGAGSAATSHGDFRLLHNIALTTFALGGCSSPGKLLRDIGSVDRYANSKDTAARFGKAATARDRLVLLLNQATLLFGEQRFSHAGQLLESMFHSIEEADDGVALRMAQLLLEVYLHTYRGAAAGDSVTRSVVSSANRIFRFLQTKRAFNDRQALVTAVEAARAAANTAAPPSGAASASASARAEPYLAPADLPADPDRLTSADVLRRADPRHVAAALCGAFAFTLHCTKARFALAANDATTAAAELRSAVSEWRAQILAVGSREATGPIRVPGTSACPPVLPAVTGDVTGSDPGAGGTDGLPLPLRARFLAHRARLAHISGRPGVAVALLDASHATSAEAGAASGCSGAGAPASSPRAVAWSSPTTGLGRPAHLSNVAVVHARTGRLHMAAALLHRAVAACGDAEADAEAASDAADAAAAPLARVTAAPPTAPPPRPAAPGALRPGPAGSAALASGIRPLLPPPRREILLNAGLVALLRRRPLEAFVHLRRAVMLFRQRPRLWVRLAEACIMYHEQSRATTSAGAVPGRIGAVWSSPSASTSQPAATLEGASVILGPDGVAAAAAERPPSSPAPVAGSERDLCWAGAGVVSATFGAGASQRFLLASQPRCCPEPALDDQRGMRALALGPDASLAQGGLGPEDAASAVRRSPQEPPAPSLQYARACLENALCLLPASAAVAIKPPAILGTVADEAAQAAAGVDAASPEDAAAAAASASASVLAASTGWRNTRAAALTKLAYVCLCLDDPVTAFRFTNQVATEAKPDETSAGPGLVHWWYLSRLYASEAMCRMGRPREAAELLASTSPPDASAEPSARAEGRPAVLVNLAVAHALSGRTGEAAAAVRDVLSQNPLATEARAVSAFVTQQASHPSDTRDLLARGIAPGTVTAAAAGGQGGQASASQGGGAVRRR